MFSLALNQVTLLVHDFAVNRKLFLDLGFNLVVDAPHGYARFVASNGVTFSLDLVPKDEVPVLHTSVLYFELESRAKLVEFCSHVESKGFAAQQGCGTMQAALRSFSNCAIVRDCRHR